MSPVAWSSIRVSKQWCRIKSHTFWSRWITFPEWIYFVALSNWYMMKRLWTSFRMVPRLITLCKSVSANRTTYLNAEQWVGPWWNMQQNITYLHFPVHSTYGLANSTALLLPLACYSYCLSCPSCIEYSIFSAQVASLGQPLTHWGRGF